jgi:3-oxoacyl-[acyl-carrier protein] reductase
MDGRVALITGGARGIGRHVALTFARAGAHVAISDVDDERLSRTANELKAIDPQALATHSDVRREAEVADLMRRVSDHFGGLDVLVNNAAIVPHFSWGTPLWPFIKDMPEDFWGRVMDTNLGGTFLCTKHALPYLEARGGGHVLNLYGGGVLHSAAYCISKDAIGAFTEFVAEEERESNVCVICVSPSAAIATEDAPEDLRRRLPGPAILERHFLLAACAGMDLSGELVTIKDGQLVVIPPGARG